jgi:hypothetical protein
MSNRGPSARGLELVEPSPYVVVASAPPAGGRLSEPERRLLAASGLTGARRAAWIAGRLVARAALIRRGIAPGDLLADADGAPRLVPAGLDVSLSHAGGRVAVAIAGVAGERVAVDLCPRAAGPRLGRLLDRLRIGRAACGAVEAWVALECLIKLRRLRLAELLRGGLAVERAGADVRVRGRGRPVVVALAARGDLVIGRSAEAC